MFARHVSIKLKAKSAPEFNRIIANEIIPLLRKEKGFEDEITFIAPERSEAAAIIYENKDRIVIEADLPGMNLEDIHLTFGNNVLTLSGERRFEKNDAADNYHRVERSYGTFTRSFAVQQTDSIEGVTAGYDNGILRIDLPKREEVKARRIEIVAQGSGESRGTRTIEAQARKAAV